VPSSYSGKKTIFLTKKQRAILLQTGGDSKYFTKPRIKDFAKQPKKLHPPPAPNISSLAVASPNVPSMTPKPTQTMMTILSPTMATRAAGWQQRQIKEKQAEDMQAFQQMEQEHQQSLQEKKKRAEEQKKEEELLKQKEEEDRKTAATAEAAAAAQVVSPGEAG
jgi:hypothetical protein